MEKRTLISAFAATALMLTFTGCNSDGSDGAVGADGETIYYESGTSDFRTPYQSASEQLLLADGLQVDYLTREAANKTDMMAFWPAENPTHIITCVEGGNEVLENGKLNPSVQSISLNDGTVETILRGMNRCDGIRTTDWGTVLATEEAGDGQAYEIIDPLSVSNNTVTDRAAGTIVQSDGTTAATKIAKRDALPTMAWEGLTVLENGVVIGGDELRPGSYTDELNSDDTDGGAIFKFVPATPRTGVSAIAQLSESPLVSGKTYAMQVQCKDGTSQWGQGCEIGNARWVEVDAANARVSANANEATGYYRPEDLHADPTYEGEGVRFCWANTGNEGAENFGEVICGIDTDPLNLVNNGSTTIVNRLVEGDTDFTSVDNLAFQAGSGNLYAIEDHTHGDIWACLPDGDDRDIKTDGCVKLLSLHDTSAEPTGFTFSPDGRTAYVSIQHSNDGNMQQVDGYGTDDILKITGFSVPNKDYTARFGAERDAMLHANAKEYFGFENPKTSSVTGTVDRNTTLADTDPEVGVIELADGLTATFLTRDAANKTDMMALWPAENPSHLISCVEGGSEIIDGASQYNPSVQSIELANGNVSTILRGMNRCDGIRTTPWGTILATEEDSAGQAYEIIDPLSVSNNTVTDRTAGTIVQSDGTTPATNVVKRDALPTMAWEGLEVLKSGVVIGGDELRPGSYTGTDGSDDTDGGSIFKFVPTTEYTATGTIASLDQSPLVDGKTYAMQVQCKDGESQHGQGCEIGNAIWVEVDPANARVSANDAEATGYYRPEDLHLDPMYEGEGVRFCWANTGNEGAEHYGEIICGIDTDPMDVVSDNTTAVNRFVEGDMDFTSVDNLAFDPATGNLYGIEDHSNGDIWACLPDGNDRDIKTDGCVRLLSLKDTSAEPTGFMFSNDGSTAYVSIQHSDDSGIAQVDNYGTDDIIKITGFDAIGNKLFNDFGNKVDEALKNNAEELFGFGTPVTESSTK